MCWKPTDNDNIFFVIKIINEMKCVYILFGNNNKYIIDKKKTPAGQMDCSLLTAYFINWFDYWIRYHIREICAWEQEMGGAILIDDFQINETINIIMLYFLGNFSQSNKTNQNKMRCDQDALDERMTSFVCKQYSIEFDELLLFFETWGW